jgi:hypothetical protein
MKKYFAFTIASVIVVLSIIACNKSAQVVNINNLNTSTTALLPLKVGDTWIYQDSIYDTVTNAAFVSIDTAQVINKSITAGGNPYWGVVETDSLGCFDYGGYLTNYQDQYGNYDVLELDSSGSPYLFWGATTVNGSQLTQTYTDFSNLSCGLTENTYGFTTQYSIAGYTCYRNIVQVQDCHGTASYVTYISAGVGVVRYEIWQQNAGSSTTSILYSQTLTKFIPK